MHKLIIKSEDKLTLNTTTLTISNTFKQITSEWAPQWLNNTTPTFKNPTGNDTRYHSVVKVGAKFLIVISDNEFQIGISAPYLTNASRLAAVGEPDIGGNMSTYLVDSIDDIPAI